MSYIIFASRDSSGQDAGGSVLLNRAGLLNQHKTHRGRQDIFLYINAVWPPGGRFFCFSGSKKVDKEINRKSLITYHNK